jgi:hypothetical protein
MSPMKMEVKGQEDQPSHSFRPTRPYSHLDILSVAIMTDKNARTVTQPSNRAIAKDVRERKAVFKAVLDNPHRIHWCVSVCLFCNE